MNKLEINKTQLSSGHNSAGMLLKYLLILYFKIHSSDQSTQYWAPRGKYCWQVLFQGCSVCSRESKQNWARHTPKTSHHETTCSGLKKVLVSFQRRGGSFAKPQRTEAASKFFVRFCKCDCNIPQRKWKFKRKLKTKLLLVFSSWMCSPTVSCAILRPAPTCHGGQTHQSLPQPEALDDLGGPADAVATTLHAAPSHVEQQGTYARLLFVD